MLGKGGFLILGIILEPVLPLAAAFAVARQRHVQRAVVAGHALVHRDDLGLRHIQLRGDLRHLLGLQVAVVDGLDLALDAAQVEEQLLLAGSGADLHKRP